VAEVDEYRVALVLPVPRQVLVIDDSGNARLPRVDIPKQTRPAEEVIAAIAKHWRVKAVVVDFLKDESMPVPCAVVEVRTKEWRFRENGLVAVDLHKIGSHDLSDRERITFNAILTGDTGDRGPFSRLGWVDDAQEWIKSALPEREVEFAEDIRQLNACGTFALIRFGTNRGPAYWLKAVGKPNTHEFTVTTNLARCYPEFLPTVLCSRPDWNAWVMEEFGRPVDSLTVHEFEQAARLFADLQIQLAGKTEDLLLFGCIDQRLPLLRARVPELMSYLAEAMGRQTSTKVQRVGQRRLGELAKILGDTCRSMEELRIPDSLIHNDTNPGNFLFDGSRCVFTDWCEAYVGSPFVTLEHLCVQMANKGAEWRAGVANLRTIYKERWLALLSAGQIERGFALAPLLAIASYLWGRGDWLRSPRRENPRFQSYSRSLGRCMDRAARDPRLLEALCP
jgi:hypothetical protein